MDGDAPALKDAVPVGVPVGVAEAVSVVVGDRVATLGVVVPVGVAV